MRGRLINAIHSVDGPPLTAHDRLMVRSLALQSPPGSAAVVETPSGKRAAWVEPGNPEDGRIRIYPRRLRPGVWRTPRRSKTAIVEYVEVA